MPTAAAPADWSSRPVPSALSADRLAALVDRSIERAEQVLFTATPTEELEEIGRWQRLKDLAFAGQVRAIVASVNRAGDVREFVGCEVGLAIGATSTTGGDLVERAVAAAALPGLIEAVEDGRLTERHVLAVLRELDRVELSLEQRQAVVLIALARYAGQAPGQLAQVVARLVVRVDRAAAAARDAVAAKARRVWFSRDVDGQAAMTARGPAAQIAAIRAALEATLGEAADGDERSRDAREFDLLVDLLTGSAEPCGWTAHIVVPFTTADGGDLELAEIPGLGPVLPQTARDLLEEARALHQVAVDETGTVIAVSDPLRRRSNRPDPAHVAHDQGPDTAPDTEGIDRDPLTPRHDALIDQLRRAPVLRDLTGTAYQVNRRLRRLLEARDRTCVFPGCGRLAADTDKDHRIPWPAGATSAANTACLCRRHHRAKHAVFTLTRHPDGTHTWTTRGGWRFHRRPQGY